MLKLFHRILRTPWRSSLACSSAVHALLVATFVFGEIWALFSIQIPAAAPALVLESPRPVDQPHTVIVEISSGSSESWLTTSAVDLTDIAATYDDPRWQEALLEASALAKTPAQSSNFIHHELLNSITAAEARAEEENLERLESLTDKLTASSSAESIDQLTTSLQRWLGTEQRATRPADEPVGGEFDLQSAQLHDVVRDDSTGEVRYTAVLLDAAGRTMESPLTRDEGESVYRVMQLMKDNPLLERVYRGVVLSFLDRLLKQQAH